SESSKVEIPIPSDSEFRAATQFVLSKGSSGESSIQAASTTDDELKLMYVVVNASGTGIEEQIKSWDIKENEARPDKISFDKAIPYGDKRLFQALFVFGSPSSGMQ